MIKGAITILSLVFVAGCATNRWGDLCQSDADCEDSELICLKAAETNVSGFCHYPDEITCGPGTLMEEQAGAFVCIPDPESPPQLVCGEGTVEENGTCVLEE